MEEAARRGLPNLGSMVEAIPALTSEKSIAVFGKFGVFTESELRSRAEIKYENYAKAINIEARTMIDMATKQFIPAAIHYTGTLADTIASVKAVGVNAPVQEKILRQCSALLEKTSDALDALRVVEEQACKVTGAKEQAEFYRAQVVPAMEALRAPVDDLEMIVDKAMWPMPSYGDLLFEV